MSIDRKISFMLIAGVAISISSCKKLLNVNTNPNQAQVATVQTLLPAAELYVGTSLGVDLEIDGSIWSQYWTQSPTASQYHILETYNPGQDIFLTPWANLYSANENFFQLYKLADSLKDKQYMAISLLMQAYTFQLITDGWGDVPFTQALKGQYADGHLVNPKYDSQMVIYNGIIAYIDSANRLLNTADPIHPGSDDLIYGGDMSKWQKFSNTLQLRVLLRMAYINPSGAQAGITALYATSPAFIGTGDDAFIAYGFGASNKNPLYAEESSTQLESTQNLVGSTTAIDSLNSNGDPRAYLFYAYVPAVGIPVGVPQGYTGKIAAGSYSIPNVYVAGDAQNVNATATYNSANAPVNFLTSWESDFLQAEVAARGWGGASGDDQAFFYKGIQDNFSYYSKQIADVYGTSATSSVDSDYLSGYLLNGTTTGTPGYWTIYPATGTTEQKLRFIITQKWFAMCGNQGFEAWTEWRRTGYPDFVTAIQSLSAGSQPKPKRFLYPTTESTTNTSYPGFKQITEKVWWDIF
jgi:hypothetical protein